MVEAYPPELREDGVGGTVGVLFYVGEGGHVEARQIFKSSGHSALDRAALDVAGVYRFSPAPNRDRAVGVWVEVPITFLQAR